MDTCALEVGLLKKKPCGSAAVAKCANCEMALCAKHAVKQKNAKFMCDECSKAQRAYEKNVGDSAPASAAPPKAAAPAAKPTAPAAKPAAPAAKAPAPAAKAPAVAPTQPAGKQEFKLDETGPLEFTPEKKK
jgi:cell wall-associated NlpC family hydrolase